MHLRNRAVFLLSLLVAQVLSGAGPQWGEKSISLPDFTAAVERVLTSSQEKTPFESIKGQVDLSVKEVAWQARLLIPGADTCRISLMDMGQVRGYPAPTAPGYTCTATFKSASKAEAGYEAAVKLLTEVTKWQAYPQKSSSGSMTMITGSDPSARPATNHTTINVLLIPNFNSVSVGFLRLNASQSTAQAHEAPGVDANRDSQLLTALRQVVAAAGEEVPFGSIEREINAARNFWWVSVELPGASACRVTLQRDAPPAPPIPRPYYECLWRYKDSSEAQTKLNQIRQVAFENQDWKSRNVDQPIAGWSPVVFHTDAAFGADVIIGVRKDASILLRVVTARDYLPEGRSSGVQAGGKWGSIGATSASFIAAFKQVLQFGRDSEAFSTLRGSPSRTGPSTWTATISLPGADGCEVLQTPEVIEGHWAPHRFMYRCMAVYDQSDSMTKGFEEILSLIENAVGEKFHRSGSSVALLSRDGHGMISVEQRTLVSKQFISLTINEIANSDARFVTIAGTGEILHRVLVSASEKIPFGSITQPEEKATASWFATLALPGADNCAIAEQPTGPSVYFCKFQSWRGLPPLDSYNALVKVVEGTGDWTSSPPAPGPQDHSRADFHGTRSPALLMLDLDASNHLTLALQAAAGH